MARTADTSAAVVEGAPGPRRGDALGTAESRHPGAASGSEWWKGRGPDHGDAAWSAGVAAGDRAAAARYPDRRGGSRWGTARQDR